MVTLYNVPDAKRVSVSLSGVTGANGVLNPTVALGFLQGDVSGNGRVNAADVSAMKAHVGQTAGVERLRFDLNQDGAINAIDVSMAKARSARVMP